MTDFVQLTFSGLTVGAVYALVAVGFVAVFTVSEVINLAQGELAALAGLVAISAAGEGFGLPLAIAVGLATATIVSVLLERLTIAPVKKLTTLTSIILTLGVSTALKALMLLIWGPDARSLAAFGGRDLVVGGVSIRAQELWILGIAAVVAAAVWTFYERSLVGKALRACSEQPVAARLVGISPRFGTVLAFGLAGLTAGIAGVISSPVYLSSWDGGLTLGLKGFVAATLGGLVSIRGALVGGLVLGVVESLVAGYVDSGLRDAVAFVVLIVVLVARPAGLVARLTRRRAVT